MKPFPPPEPNDETLKQITLDAEQVDAGGFADYKDGDSVVIHAKVKKGDDDGVTLTNLEVEHDGEKEGDEPKPGEAEIEPEPETLGGDAAARMGVKPKTSRNLSPKEAGLEQEI